MASKANRWLKLFEAFVGDIRISSKEVASTDERGSPLVLWESQRRFMRAVGEGLDSGVHAFNCLKSRQLGVTTLSLALVDVFWPAMHPNLIGCLVTDTEKNREVNRALIKKYVQSFPDGYFGDEFRIVTDNRQMIKFSNGSRLDLLVAGVKDKGTSWGEGVGYAFAHLTECASYGSVEGLKSLEEGFAQKNPNRLFVYESTAKGFNHWRTRWVNGQNDPLNQRSFFIGWWAGDTNRIERKDPRFSRFGTARPTFEEQELIEQVAKLYGHKITVEQLAWIRWKEDNAGAEQDLLLQNQPWTAEQSFVMTGYSFFQTRVITGDIKKLEEQPPVFKGYRYEVDGDFFHFRMIELDPKKDNIEDVELKVWEEPADDGQYVIGFDPAYGRNDHKDHHCLDQTTELLTKSGWRKFEDIQLGDEAVCFDPDTGAYEYGAVSRKIVKRHEGPMHHFTSKGLDCLATPEHRVLSRNYRVLRDGRKQGWKFYTAREIAVAGRSVREIPIGGSPFGPGVPGLSLDMCRALGWILTDGHIGGGRYTGKTGLREGRRVARHFISLSQSLLTVKGGVVVADVMRDVMLTLCPGVRVTDYPGDGDREAWRTIRVGVAESAKFIHWLGGNSGRVPRLIMEGGSEEQIEALFQGLLDGDGNWSGRDQRWVRVCPGLDSGFADDVQEIAVKLGYSATKTIQKDVASGGEQWIVRLSTRDTHTFEATNVKTVEYSGSVWCVTVPTGAFVARRNGKTFVTGNCLSVWRCYADKLVQVAEYCTADVETKHAAWVLFHLSAAYRNCMVNVELGGPGQMIMPEYEHLRQLLASEVHAGKTVARDWQDAASQARWYLYHRPDSFGAGYMANFETTWRTKAVIMHQLRGCYVSRELEIRSKALLREMSIVVVEDGSIGAPESSDENAKDDRVFAMALATRAWLDWIRKDMLAQGLTYDSVSQAESGVTPPVAKSVNSLVYNFLKSAEEKANEPEAPPKWMTDHGLA